MNINDVLAKMDLLLQQTGTGNLSHKIGNIRNQINLVREMLEPDWQTDISKAKQCEDYWFATNKGLVFLGFIDYFGADRMQVLNKETDEAEEITDVVAFCEYIKPVHNA